MPLPSYLDLAAFRQRTIMSVVEVDYVETDSPGFVASRIDIATSWIHGRLRKRYGNSLPFAAPYPEILLDWITRLVTYDVMRKRGMNPSDPAAQQYLDDAKRAQDEVKESADSKDGLFDLPSPEEGDSNVSTAAPLGYSETSPYVWTNTQRGVGAAEDRNSRSGSGGNFGEGDG